MFKTITQKNSIDFLLVYWSSIGLLDFYSKFSISAECRTMDDDIFSFLFVW